MSLQYPPDEQERINVIAGLGTFHDGTDINPLSRAAPGPGDTILTDNPVGQGVSAG